MVTITSNQNTKCRYNKNNKKNKNTIWKNRYITIITDSGMRLARYQHGNLKIDDIINNNVYFLDYTDILKQIDMKCNFLNVTYLSSNVLPK